LAIFCFISSPKGVNDPVLLSKRVLSKSDLIGFALDLFSAGRSNIFFFWLSKLVSSFSN